MMNRVVMSVVVGCAALASAAQAADLGVRKPALPALAVPAMNWSGFYVGAHVGWTGLRESQRFVAPGLNMPISNNASGVLGGVHAGYNLQAGKLVYGVEADVSANSIDKRFSIGAPFVATTGTVKLDWQGSLRGRLGYALFDRGLVYATGGVALGNFRNAYDSGAPFIQSVSSTRVGWTLGAGLEYAFTRNLIARTEYRYTGWGSHTNNLTVFLAPPGTSRSRVSQHQVTAGLSYLFGAP